MPELVSTDSQPGSEVGSRFQVSGCPPLLQSVSGNVLLAPPGSSDPKSSGFGLEHNNGGFNGVFTVSVTDTDVFPPLEVKFNVAE